MSGQLEHLRSFEAVCRTGGFSAAARHLGLSPTIVTRHVADLEAQLGVQLLTRTTRKVDMTDAGRSYLARVTPILRDLVAADEDVRAQQVGLSGVLKMSAPLSFGLAFLPDIVAQFRILHPSVDVDVQLTDQFVDIAGDGFDLALRISEPPKDQSTIWHKICEIPRVIVASPTYLEQHGVPMNPSALKGHQCLHYAHVAGAPVWPLQRGKGAVRAAVTACFTANNGDLIGRLAARGEGIALLPKFIVQDALGSGVVVEVLEDWEPPQIWLSISLPPYARLPAKVSAFMSFIEAHMRSV